MTTVKKVFAVIGAAFALSVLGWGLLIGAVYAYGGVMTVRVENAHGPNFAIPIPMAVVEAAAATGDVALDELEAELGAWGPALVELLGVLSDCPDATFVEVEDGDDYVRVAKEGRYLRIEVSDPGVDVEVSIPMRAASRTIARIVS